MNTAAIAQKLWNYCNVLLDDGMGYGDYVEQLTYLLFLKMTDERARAPYNRKSPIPAGNDGPRLLKRGVWSRKPFQQVGRSRQVASR